MMGEKRSKLSLKFWRKPKPTASAAPNTQADPSGHSPPVGTSATGPNVSQEVVPEDGMAHKI